MIACSHGGLDRRQFVAAVMIAAARFGQHSVYDVTTRRGATRPVAVDLAATAASFVQSLPEVTPDDSTVVLDADSGTVGGPPLGCCSTIVLHLGADRSSLDVSPALGTWAAEQLARSIDAVSGALDGPLTVGELPVMDDEQSRVVEACERWHPVEIRPLDAVLYDAVDERRNAVAVQDGDRVVTYGELWNSAVAVASSLVNRGVVPGARVGIVLEPSVEEIVGCLGIALAGACYVALPRRDPLTHLQHLVDATGMTVALVDGEAVRVATALGVTPVDLGTITEHVPVDAELPSLDADDAVYIGFTSGSTGVPKGTVVPWRGVVRLAEASRRFLPGDAPRVMRYAPLAFDASTLEIFVPLLRGGTVVVGPTAPTPLHELAAYVSSGRISAAWLTAGLFHRLADRYPECFDGLNVLMTGGDVVDPARVSAVRRQAPRTQIVNGYGPTENTTFTTTFSIHPGDSDRHDFPIGVPVAGTGVRLLDPRDGARVAPGAVGELVCVGQGVARGYLEPRDHPAFRLLDGVPAYRTGDRCRYDGDGQLHFLGRVDNQRKIAGHRVELGAVEGHLLGLPAVAEAVAFFYGGASGEVSLGAAITVEAPAPARRELLRALRAHAPSHLVPRRLAVVDRLPLNRNGKVDRRELLQQVTAAMGGGDAG